MKIVAFLGKWLGFLVGLGASFFVIMALAGPLGFPFELFMAWAYLVGAIGLFGAIFAGLLGWPKFGTAIFAGAIAVIAIAMASPGDLTRAKAPPLTPGTDRLIWGNTLGLQTSARELSARTQALGDKTVLALGEVPRFWTWQTLPARRSLNVQRVGGLAVEGCAAASQPFRNEGEYGGKRRIRTFGLKIECPNYTLFAVHLTNPLWERGLRFARREEEFVTLAAAVKAQTGPVVVIGDFNTPPNAPAVARFMTQANLNKTSCGGRWVPTWRPLGWRERFDQGNPLTGIPIDHLYTRDIDVIACTVGKDFGSDHLPLVVELRKQSQGQTQRQTP